MRAMANGVRMVLPDLLGGILLESAEKSCTRSLTPPDLRWIEVFQHLHTVNVAGQPYVDRVADRNVVHFSNS